MVGKYWLLKPTLGVFAGNHRGMPIPVGAVIEIADAPDDGHRMIDVIWDGQPLLTFVGDLRDRSEKVDSPDD